MTEKQLRQHYVDTAASVAASVMQTAVTIQATPYHEVKRE